MVGIIGGMESMFDKTGQQHFDWASQFNEQIEAILRKHIPDIAIISIASPERDMKECTDMVVKIDAGDVAVRIRKNRYLAFRDLTIRSYSRGYTTEIHKIKAGYGDWYLYCWLGVGDLLIDNYILVDINKLRDNDLLETKETQMNPDGITGFVSISIDELKETGSIVHDTLCEMS